MIKHVKFSETLFLNKIVLETEDTTKATVVVRQNHILIIDVSGSMSGSLKQIREQLKMVIPKIINPDDTLTLMWFSGRNEAGIVLDAVKISTLADIKDYYNAIDKYIIPVGMTSFSKPVKLLVDVINNLNVLNNNVNNLLFLTDGMHNTSDSWNDIINNLKNVSGNILSSTFVEYGYYADSAKLIEMTEAIGGEKIIASDFYTYEPIVENKISKNATSLKKIKVDIYNSKYDFAYSFNDNEILSYKITDNSVSVPDQTKYLYFFSSNAIGISGEFSDTEIYTSIYSLSERMLNSDSEIIFNSLGDVFLYKLFSNALGKQKINQYKEYLKDSIFDISKRFRDGKSFNLVPKDDAYCFIDLINELSSNDNNIFYPMHEEFNYNKTGTKRKKKITSDIKSEIDKCTSIEDLTKLVNELSADKKTELKFVNTDTEKGFPLSSIVWNENKANLSVMVKYNGYVELPKNDFGISKIDTFIYRNYTFVKDGILNITKIPVTLSDDTFNKLQNIDGLKISKINDTISLLDFEFLPILNRNMFKKTSAIKLANLEWQSLKLKANKKVYDYYSKLLYPKVSEGFVQLYGVEGEKYLKELGITESNGFSVSSSTVYDNDCSLEIKVSGYSALPKVDDVMKKLNENKSLKDSDKLLQPAIESVTSQVNSPLYKSQTQDIQDTILKAWLKEETIKFNKEKRYVMSEISKIKFSLIISKNWFEEFASFDENELNLEIDNNNLKFKFVFTEKEH